MLFISTRVKKVARVASGALCVTDREAACGQHGDAEEGAGRRQPVDRPASAAVQSVQHTTAGDLLTLGVDAARPNYSDDRSRSEKSIWYYLMMGMYYVDGKILFGCAQRMCGVLSD